ARVSLTTMTGRFGMGTGPQPVDANGGFTFEQLRPDQQHSISAEAPHFGRASSGTISFKPGETTVELKPLTLKPANSIVTGVVVDENNQPVVGVTVRLYGRESA